MTKACDQRSVIRSYNVADFITSKNERFNVEGHAAVYDQVVNIGGWFNEVIERGAFENCDFSDVSLFVNHDLNRIPLARSRLNKENSTMHLKVDERGLFIQADLDIENNLEAKTLHNAIQRGDIDGMSFAFYIADESWEDLDKATPLRRIKKISQVYEVSAVTYPAYDQTEINARNKNDMESAKRVVQEARSKNVDNQLKIEKLRTQILLKG